MPTNTHPPLPRPYTIQTTSRLGTLSPLPHILIPITCLLPFLFPPLPGRGLLGATAIAINYTLIIYARWPDLKPPRYGFAGSWLWILPICEKLALHDIETEFWKLGTITSPASTDTHSQDQVDGKEGDCKETSSISIPRKIPWPPPLTLARLSYTSSLLATPRGIGFNFGPHPLPPPRRTDAISSTTRTNYATRQLSLGFLCMVVAEATSFLSKKLFPVPWSLTLASSPRMLALEALLAISIYSSMRIQDLFGSAISVWLGLYDPEDWPAIYGAVWEVVSVAGFWGGFWHGLLKGPSLGISRRLARFLGLRRRGLPRYALHLLTGFGLSAAFHVANISVVMEDLLTLGELSESMFMFFLSQAVGIMGEEIAKGWWKALLRRIRDNGEESNGVRVVKEWENCIGRAWAFAWLSLTGWWFARAYLAIGIMDWNAAAGPVGFIWRYWNR